MGRYLMQKDGKNEIDIEDYFKGLRVLSVKGFGEFGEANNIYIERWIGSNDADVFIPTDSEGNATISYAPKDVVITFFISSSTANINVLTLKNTFLNYIQGATYFTDGYRRLKNKLIFMGSTENSLERYSERYNYVQFSCKFEKVSSIDTSYIGFLDFNKQVLKTADNQTLKVLL